MTAWLLSFVARLFLLLAGRAMNIQMVGETGAGRVSSVGGRGAASRLGLVPLCVFQEYAIHCYLTYSEFNAFYSLFLPAKSRSGLTCFLWVRPKLSTQVHSMVRVPGYKCD